MSTRAVVNAWESGANSSRESLGPTPQGSRIGQHLNRLHKKAQDQENLGPRSQSVMSDMTHPSSSFNSSTARRASDPGRVLDRNFGVNGQLSRHRSGSYAGSQQENPQSYQVSLSHFVNVCLTSLEPLFDLCLLLLQFPPASSQAQSYQPFPQHQQNFNYGAWQFNGFQPGFSYNYNSFNTSGGASGPGAAQAQTQHSSGANWNHQQWNNWNYYGSNTAAQQESSDSQASSYQRTLEYVQQQSSWSANN